MATPHHPDVTGGWLRAAVFGAMDGLGTNIALIAGVAGAGLAPHDVIRTGIAGLFAGAFSMALGEYTSVHTQNEQVQAEVNRERIELQRNPEGEAAEFAQLWIDRGVPPEMAHDLAGYVAKDLESATNIHAQEELGVNPAALPKPWLAAISSFICFALGAMVPLIPYLFGSHLLWASLAFGGLGLYAAGAFAARFTHRPMWLGGLRQLVLGSLAVGITYSIGLLFQ